MNGSEPGQVIQPGGQTPEPEVTSDQQSNPDMVNQTPGYFKPESGESTASPFSSTENQKSPEDIFSRDDIVVEWTASEFVDHQKTLVWFVILGLIAIGVGVAIYLLSGDKFAPIIIVLLAVIFGIGAARRPRELGYAITSSGVEIENKLYPYSDLKSFGLLKEGSIESILLLPSKRWQPPISLYVDPSEIDRIVDSLGTFLPYEERSTGFIDKFLHKIRF